MIANERETGTYGKEKIRKEAPSRLSLRTRDRALQFRASDWGRGSYKITRRTVSRNMNSRNVDFTADTCVCKE